MTAQPTTEVPVFGVRHLSPGCSWQLKRMLDDQRPKVVLIEGPGDADELIPHIVDRGCKLPIAILAFSEDLPVETLVYPFAEYSPEYVALKWANDNRAEAHFIDLPAGTFLGLQRQERERMLAAMEAKMEAEDEDVEAEETEPKQATERRSTYRQIAEASGEQDYDSYWEGQFEVATDPMAYMRATRELGETIRHLDDSPQIHAAENTVREAHMRRCIQQYVDSGVEPSDMLVIVGAYHVPAISPDLPPITDKELAALPSAPRKLTLMPYSYFRLSSQSGYGAGNNAPAYFDLIWRGLKSGNPEAIPVEYLASIARELRKTGSFRSTAEVIEAVRLAKGIASLHGRGNPVLAELQDAAVTLIGQGERSVIASAMAKVEVGTEIGSVPEGVCQTSIQDDFSRELSRLKLDKYRTNVAQDLALDLRENRRVKTEEAAFLDLNRSSFLHRLAVLEIPFAEKRASRQDSTTWAENWVLQWTPEAEICLVEAVLKGETVELAVGFKLNEMLEESKTVRDAAAVVRMACECDLPKAMAKARAALQGVAAEASQFDDIAQALSDLALIARYGDIRRFSPEPLMPLIEQLFRQGALQLMPSANCDRDTAVRYQESMSQLDRVAVEFSDLIDEELWHSQLRRLSDSDAHNPLLSGFACALLLERQIIDDDHLGIELSRRLSPGIEADLGAGWFEGLSKRNRYALLSRIKLWEQLAGYIESLEEEEFRRALVFLRRAFENFGPQEKRSIAENLGEIWGVGADAASEILSAELSEAEQEAIEELNDFDFDDL